MSRPLTGRIVANPSGTFTASLPKALGSVKRHEGTFETRAAAERWLRSCVVAREGGKPLPGAPKLGRSKGTPTAPLGVSFKHMGEAFVRERYVEDGHGDVGRETQVLGYIEIVDRYMRDEHLTVEAITRQDARAMYRHLLRTDTTKPATFPHELDPGDLVSKRQGRALLASNGFLVSESTFNRAVREGLFRAVDTTGRAHLYRLGDLFAPSSGLAVDRTSGAAASSEGRYKHSTLSAVRRTFRDVMAYAESEGIRLQPGVRKAQLSGNRTPKVKMRALTLTETARVAGRLHVVHQLVLWLLRCLGLRISEAYGLLVEDVLDMGPGLPGLLTIQSQGGRKFRRRDAAGNVQTTDRVDALKRDSFRVLVVPEQVMALIRAVIDVFHTDSDGVVRTGTRLVPGLAKSDSGGQQAFREALRVAAAAEGLDVRLDKKRRAPVSGLEPVRPTPQHMRKSFATGLQASASTIENIQAFMGHKRGTEVIHENYLLEDPDLQPQRAIAEAMSAQILSEVDGGLMMSTTASCTTGNQPALATRKAEIDAALMEAGWLVCGDALGDGWVDVNDAAALQGVDPAYIRELIRDGKLPAIKAPRADQGGWQYWIAIDDALASRDERSGRLSMRTLAAELDRSYDTIRQYIRRRPDLECEPFGERDHHVPEEVAERLRLYFRGQAELEARATRMPEVARTLGVSVAAVDTLIKKGMLVEDDRFHGGVRSVRTATLEAHRRGRGARTPRVRRTR